MVNPDTLACFPWKNLLNYQRVAMSWFAPLGEKNGPSVAGSCPQTPWGASDKPSSDVLRKKLKKAEAEGALF
jgi:hypothetical protein